MRHFRAFYMVLWGFILYSSSCITRAPQSSFSIEQSPPYYLSTSLRFKNTSSPSTDFLWDFGDGVQSNVFEPSHSYGKIGTYNVTLKAENFEKGDDVFTISVEVLPDPPAKPKAAFDPSTSNCTAPCTVQFTNKTTGDGTIEYYWDFGDGADTSMVFSPLHEYKISSNTPYLVRLIASNNVGSDTIIKQISINDEPEIDSLELISLSYPIVFGNYDVDGYPDIFAQIFYRTGPNQPWIPEGKTLQFDELSTLPQYFPADPNNNVISNFTSEHIVYLFDYDDVGKVDTIDYSEFIPSEFQNPPRDIIAFDSSGLILRFILHIAW